MDELCEVYGENPVMEPSVYAPERHQEAVRLDCNDNTLYYAPDA